MAKKGPGRKKGGHNRGYFFRKGRGWYGIDGARQVPLRYEDGVHIKVKNTDEQDVREANARFLLDKQQKQQVRDDTLILEVCDRYLADVKQNGAAKTHAYRSDTLFDFCFGLPPEHRNKFAPDPFRDPGKEGEVRITEQRKKELAEQKIHKGYGAVSVVDFAAADLSDWLNAHKTWSQSGRRTRIQAVKRALNFAVEEQQIKANPIRGYRTPRSESSITYINPEHEEQLLENSNPSFKIALKVCIRTGARFGSEFAKVTAAHVKDEDDKMAWVFTKDEIKNRRKRVIYITDPEIIKIVRDLIGTQKRNEPLFRNTLGMPWNKKSLSLRFRTVRNKLMKTGVECDADCCMYSCRHTYAKRTLQGYWTGKPTNIETLAQLMGNTPAVCRQHYLQWSPLDNQAAWDAA